MAKFTLTHTINCGADKCAKLYSDPAFNEALYKQRFGYSAFTVASRTETDAQIACAYTGKNLSRTLAAPARAQTGDIAYKDSFVFDKAKQSGQAKLTPLASPEKFLLQASVSITPVGDSQVNLVREYLVEAKVFGIGGLLEGEFEKLLREEAEAGAALLNEWIAQGKA